MHYSPSSTKAAGHPTAAFHILSVSQYALSRFQMINPTMNETDPVQNTFMIARLVAAEMGVDTRRESTVVLAATESMRMAKMA